MHDRFSRNCLRIVQTALFLVLCTGDCIHGGCLYCVLSHLACLSLIWLCNPWQLTLRRFEIGMRDRGRKNRLTGDEKCTTLSGAGHGRAHRGRMPSVLAVATPVSVCYQTSAIRWTFKVLARRSFLLTAPHTWNSLPSDVRSCVVVVWHSG